MKIPQTNPYANYMTHQAEINRAIQRVLMSGQYILGKEVLKFEKQFAKLMSISYATGVANGTDAIELALRACDIHPGDIVIVPSHTAVATIAAIERTGAVPRFVDVEPQSYTMSVESLKSFLKISDKNVKAVIPVHLYGHPAEMPAIVLLARRYGLNVIEDCAQAHGAAIEGRQVGTWGDCGAFSFYPTKNLGALGDGGIVVTDHSRIAQKLRLIREYGWKQRQYSVMSGVNSRLDEIQAAVLNIKLKYLKSDNKKRQNVAQQYKKQLNDSGLILPSISKNVTHVFHQYVIRSRQRDALKLELAKKGIQTAIHYPWPVHLQPAYRKRIPKGVPLPVTEMISKEILSLPMFPEMTSMMTSQVVAEIKRILNS